ncbi:MAG: Uma2 family endonuclease [Chloroflexi bacterium]|nr:Uma2 family endonuclease [Chloroflexota bacterium]
MVTRDALQVFEEFIARPENVDKLFEFVNGEIIEVSPGRTRHSEIGHLLAVAVHVFCRQRGLSCHTSGGDGAYRIQGHVLAPDFAYKRTPMSETYPDPDAPEWVVEIISPADKAADIREKRQIYRQAGILLWEIYPQSQSVDVYAPGQPLRVVETDGSLDGGAVLPGFVLPLRDLFDPPGAG